MTPIAQPARRRAADPAGQLRPWLRAAGVLAVAAVLVLASGIAAAQQRTSRAKGQQTSYGTSAPGAASRAPQADPPADAATPELAATLRPQAEVSADVVRLSDLFDGVPDSVDVAIARAPDPGSSFALEAAYLAQISLRYKLGWRPESRFDRITVTRRSALIDQEAITAALRKGFAREGLSPELEISLDGSQRSMHVPPGQGQLAVERMSVDRLNGRFVATLGLGATKLQVTGRVVELLKVPVLSDRLGPDDVIRAANLRWITVRADRLQSDIITDADSLIGMSPRRGLTPGSAVRANDIRQAIVVKKNNVVAMVFRTPYMVLTAQGRALEDGALGETIRVVNTSTQRTVYAQVAGPHEVAIFATHRLASN